jgi:hypothetical protein
MAYQTPLDRLGHELEAAAERQAAAAVAPRRTRRRRGRSLGLFGVLAAFGVAAGAWAAIASLSPGSPVPYAFGPPVAGQAQGAPLAGTVKLLTAAVPDPAGGPPWGMRYWETDRKYGCLQVGRVYEGKLGQIRGRVFHELRVGVVGNALGRCFLLDGGGHGFSASQVDALAGAQPPPCPVPVGTIRVKGSAVKCRAERTIDFGLLGPNAESYTYRLAGHEHRGAPLADVGGYLVVQRYLKPVERVVGFHHKDPRLDFRAPVLANLALTPTTPVIRQVVYQTGTCTVRTTASPRGSCARQAGYVPIPQPSVRDVRAPVHVRLLADGRTFRVRFRARQAVSDGRSAYNIQIQPKHGRGSVGRSYDHNLQAGSLVKTTFRARNGWHGTYVITATFRTVRARPGPIGSPASPGVLVGRAEVTFE